MIYKAPTSIKNQGALNCIDYAALLRYTLQLQSHFTVLLYIQNETFSVHFQEE